MQRGVLLLASLLLITACSGGDDHADSTTTTTERLATVPSRVEPGQAWLALDTDDVELKVSECGSDEPSPVTQTAQRVFHFAATGYFGNLNVNVRGDRFETDSGDAKAATETVTVTTGSGEDLRGLVAKRSYFDGRWVDLNDPAAKKALFEHRGDQLTVVARFGPQGSRAGDKGIVDGKLIAECR